MALFLLVPVVVAAPLAPFFLTYEHAVATGKNSVLMTVYGKTTCMRIIRRFATGRSYMSGRRARRVELRLQTRAEMVKSVASGQIVFVGSSILAYWRNMAQDLAPLPCVNAAAGGARTTDLLPFVDDLVVKTQPKCIVYYCGSNDLLAKMSVEGAVAGFEKFYLAVKQQLPRVKLIYVSILVSPLQVFMGIEDKVAQVNSSIKSMIEEGETGDFQGACFLDLNVEPRFKTDWTLYINDGLHLNDLGHKLMGEMILPRLCKLLEAEM